MTGVATIGKAGLQWRGRPGQTRHEYAEAGHQKDADQRAEHDAEPAASTRTVQKDRACRTVARTGHLCLYLIPDHAILDARPTRLPVRGWPIHGPAGRLLPRHNPTATPSAGASPIATIRPCTWSQITSFTA